LGDSSSKSVCGLDFLRDSLGTFKKTGGKTGGRFFKNIREQFFRMPAILNCAAIVFIP